MSSRDLRGLEGVGVGAWAREARFLVEAPLAFLCFEEGREVFFL